MIMMTAKLFENAFSHCKVHSVELRKNISFDVVMKLPINKVGDIVILIPKDNKWSGFSEQFGTVFG